MKPNHDGERRRKKQVREAYTTVVVEEILGQDMFRSTRTDRQVEKLEKTVSAHYGEPYLHLLNALLGTGYGLSERAAVSIWKRIVEHRVAMRDKLGRNVPLRAAAIDWLYLQDASRRPFDAVVVSHALLASALDEGRLDSMTHLPTRRFFEEMLARYLQTRPFPSGSLAFVDLDGFKAVNDKFGHARGDWVLAEFAKAARVSIRAGDVLGRIGGDEFAIVFSETGARDARRVVQRIRIAFERRCQPMEVSFSFGIVDVVEGQSPEEVMTRADQVMYNDKEARRGIPSRQG